MPQLSLSNWQFLLIIDEKMRATLAVKTFNLRMDPGERDLMAYAITQKLGDFILCGPDGALVRAAVYTSLGSNVLSLEEVARAAGKTAESILNRVWNFAPNDYSKLRYLKKSFRSFRFLTKAFASASMKFCVHIEPIAH
jgi:hypothetical protein